MRVGMKACWNTASDTCSSAVRSMGRSPARSFMRSSTASTLSSVMVGSTAKSKSSLLVSTATPLRRKKSLQCEQSARRKSSARGWSRSTAWLTSMIQRRPSSHRMLYSLRSACTRRHCWYSCRTTRTSSSYAPRSRDSESPASFRRGAATPCEPTNSMTSTCERSRMGSGARMPALRRRDRLRISFSAHTLTICRGLPFP
mmetsp:Transcript_32443/g.82900  ORF Transcript_32443/g.82900 Transcript_32443/m.82900 type:complete len:200 (+) Transcript_32443:265-864(+)